MGMKRDTSRNESVIALLIFEAFLYEICKVFGKVCVEMSGVILDNLD